MMWAADEMPRIDAYRKERNIQPCQWITLLGVFHNTLEEGRHPINSPWTKPPHKTRYHRPPCSTRL